MAIRKVNKTLCGLLGIAVLVAFVSYYFAMSNELTLNKLSRQIMMQYNMLTKAAKVIEVQAVNSAVPVVSQPTKTASFNWAVGY